MSSAARVLTGLIAGLAVGIGISRLAEPTLLAIPSAIEPVGTLWINAIRMTVIPLVVSLLISRIASETPASVGRIGGRALLLFVLFVAGAALFTAAIAPSIVERMWLDPSTVAAARSGATGLKGEAPSLRDWLLGLVPPNAFKAAAEGEMLPVVVFTVFFACGLARVREDQRLLIVRFFDALADTMLVLVRWILSLAPIGVFALSLGLAARGGAGIAGALGQYVIVVCALITLGLLALYPIVTLAGGGSMRRFTRACAPVQAVAFSTRSSIASLPAMIDAAEHKLVLPAQVSGLILPIAVSVFKFGAPILRLTGTLFVARLYGVVLDSPAIATMAVATAALSFYSPGIPSGGLLVVTPVFSAFGLPLEGLGLLLAVDLIPDMFVTVSNVTADMAVATIIGRQMSAVTRVTARDESVLLTPNS
jgi:Na+/H+-dicarboxylate symporter